MPVSRRMGGVWITWRLAVEVGYCRRSTGTLRNVPSSAAMPALTERMYVCTSVECIIDKCTRKCVQGNGYKESVQGKVYSARLTSQSAF